MKKTFPNHSIFIALGVLILVGMILIPLPALLLDILTALALIITVLILSSSLSFKKNRDFSLLPSCLLILTLFGLLIQISFARLILTQGEAFTGLIIRCISSLVIRPNEIADIVVSFLFFAFFTAVIRVFFVKGAVRAAERAARFYIDAMPGKQMAIDAEYSAGKITKEEANIKKEALQREPDFYGALDGAGKFISGFFKASIFITISSILGGFIICVVTDGIIFNGEALENGSLFVAMTISADSIKNLIWVYIRFSMANSLLSQFMVLLWCITVSLFVYSCKFLIEQPIN